MALTLRCVNERFIKGLRPGRCSAGFCVINCVTLVISKTMINTIATRLPPLRPEAIYIFCKCKQAFTPVYCTVSLSQKSAGAGLVPDALGVAPRGQPPTVLSKNICAPGRNAEAGRSRTEIRGAHHRCVWVHANRAVFEFARTFGETFRRRR